jgi:hypothetical protein
MAFLFLEDCFTRESSEANFIFPEPDVLVGPVP